MNAVSGYPRVAGLTQQGRCGRTKRSSASQHRRSAGTKLSEQPTALSGLQFAAVRESIELNKTIRSEVAVSDPVWPLGLS